MGAMRERFLRAWAKAERTGPVGLELSLGVMSILWGWTLVVYEVRLDGLSGLALTVAALGGVTSVDLLGCGLILLGTVQVLGVLLLRASLRVLAAFLTAIVWAFVLGTDATAYGLRLASAQYIVQIMFQVFVYVSLRTIFDGGRD